MSSVYNPQQQDTNAATAAALGRFLRAPDPLVEMLPVAAYACDPAGRLLWYNRRAADLWGRAPRTHDDSERYCGSLALHVDGQPLAPDESPVARVLRTGEAVDNVEAVVERPDGSRRWVMVHVHPVRDQEGLILGAINCFHDTTDKHEAGDALQQKQDELEDFFENSAVALHIVGADGTILRANKAELALLGYPVDEYVGRHIKEFHADPAAIADILVRLGRGERLDRYPARLRARDGSVRDVLITSSTRKQDGQPMSTRCFTVDVTRERVARDRAADADDRFRQLLQALPAAIYTTDAEGRVTYYNQASIALAGREPVLGEDRWCISWRLYHPDGRPMPHDECPMAVALRENRPIRNVEALAERPDGSRVPILPYPTPLHDRYGNVAGAVNMLIDISDRKQAETRQVLLLRELNHRVKNNMQTLQSLLMSAQRESANAEARTVLANASRRVAAMAAAQQVLYDEDQPTNFSATDFLESVCGAARNAAGEGTEILIEAATGTLGNDAAMPLALILNELLTNAIRHAGGPVHVALTCDNGTCRLCVTDGGPGFDLQTVPRRRASGLGLVDGLARQLGGTLMVERADGGGARCVVLFPTVRGGVL